MPPSKRMSTDSTCGPAKKAAKGAGPSDISVLVASFSNDTWMPDSLPPKARELLAAGAPHALSPFSEDRHPLQNKMIDNIREALEKAAAELSERVDGAHREAAVKEASLEGAEAKKQAAHAAMDATRAAIDAQKQKLAEKTSLVKAAEKEVKSIEASQKECSKENAAYNKEKDRFKAIEESGLQPLVDNALSDKEAKKASAKFIKDMEKLGADGSMVASVPAVLLKKKEERQSFDNMVVDQLRGTIHERIATIDAALEANETQGRQLAADLEAKQSTLQDRQKDQSDDSADLQRLQSAFTDAAQQEGQALELVDSIQVARKDFAAAAAQAENEGVRLQAVRDLFETMAARTREVPKETIEIQQPSIQVQETIQEPLQEPLAVA